MHDNHGRTVDMFIKHVYPGLESKGYKFIALDQNQAIVDRLAKYAGKPLGSDSIKIPGGDHPPAVVTLPPPSPRPCTPTASVAMFDDKFA
ncbi:MAG: hypothetical protein RL189_2813 [Pseudomonadota bacterium]|jgi:hypothetical protein